MACRLLSKVEEGEARARGAGSEKSEVERENSRLRTIRHDCVGGAVLEVAQPGTDAVNHAKDSAASVAVI